MSNLYYNEDDPYYCFIVHEKDVSQLPDGSHRVNHPNGRVITLKKIMAVRNKLTGHLLVISWPADNCTEVLS